MFALRPFLQKCAEESKGQNPVKYCQTNLVVDYVKYYFDKDIEKTPRRALLASVYHKSDVHFCLSGTIIDREKFTLIAQPPMNFRTMTYQDIDLKNYYVFPNNTGTFITLYYYKKQWEISTGKRHYASRTPMVYGDMNYRSALLECLPADFNWKSLDTGKCYTLGFSHPKTHPGSEKRVWMIASFGVADWNAGKDVVHDWFAKVPGIENLEEVKEMDFASLATAYNKYVEDGTKNYGYILRSRDESKTQTASCVILKSTLLQKIDMILYANAHNDEIIQMNYDRFRFMALRAILSPDGPAFFIQWTGAGELIDGLNKQIIEAVGHIAELYEKKEVARDTVEKRLAHSLFKDIKSFLHTADVNLIANMVAVKDYLPVFASNLLKQ